MGMGSFLAVSRASNLGARLIHLTYSPGAPKKGWLGSLRLHRCPDGLVEFGLVWDYWITKLNWDRRRSCDPLDAFEMVRVWCS